MTKYVRCDLSREKITKKSVSKSLKQRLSFCKIDKGHCHRHEMMMMRKNCSVPCFIISSSFTYIDRAYNFTYVNELYVVLE